MKDKIKLDKLNNCISLVLNLKLRSESNESNDTTKKAAPRIGLVWATDLRL